MAKIETKVKSFLKKTYKYKTIFLFGLLVGWFIFRWDYMINLVSGFTGARFPVATLGKGRIIGKAGRVAKF